jgi:multidrug efflux pump subunit AcrA (membrane-fusion protein)
MSAAAILKLQASGFSADQVSALAELIDTQAATKADVEAAKHDLELKVSELRSDLESTEHRLELKIDGVEHRLELKIEGLDRKITETNANTLKRVISAIGFQTLVLVGTIVGAVAALTRFIPAAPIIHQ